MIILKFARREVPVFFTSSCTDNKVNVIILLKSFVIPKN